MNISYVVVFQKFLSVVVYRLNGDFLEHVSLILLITEKKKHRWKQAQNLDH